MAPSFFSHRQPKNSHINIHSAHHNSYGAHAVAQYATIHRDNELLPYWKNLVKQIHIHTYCTHTQEEHTYTSAIHSHTKYDTRPIKYTPIYYTHILTKMKRLQKANDRAFSTHVVLFFRWQTKRTNVLYYIE